MVVIGTGGEPHRLDASGHVVRRYPCATGELGRVRRDVESTARSLGFGPLDVDRAVLVVSELASNAVQASPGEVLGVDLSAPDPLHLLIVVMNRSGRAPPSRDDWGPIHRLAPRGRGLSIVDALSEDMSVDYDPVSGRVVVSASLRMPASTPEDRDV